MSEYQAIALVLHDQTLQRLRAALTENRDQAQKKVAELKKMIDHIDKAGLEVHDKIWREIHQHALDHKLMPNLPYEKVALAFRHGALAWRMRSDNETSHNDECSCPVCTITRLIRGD